MSIWAFRCGILVAMVFFVGCNYLTNTVSVRSVGLGHTPELFVDASQMPVGVYSVNSEEDDTYILFGLIKINNGLKTTVQVPAGTRIVLVPPSSTQPTTEPAAMPSTMPGEIPKPTDTSAGK